MSYLPNKVLVYPVMLLRLEEVNKATLLIRDSNPVQVFVTPIDFVLKLKTVSFYMKRVSEKFSHSQ